MQNHQPQLLVQALWYKKKIQGEGLLFCLFLGVLKISSFCKASGDIWCLEQNRKHNLSTCMFVCVAYLKLVMGKYNLYFTFLLLFLSLNLDQKYSKDLQEPSESFPDLCLFVCLCLESGSHISDQPQPLSPPA